MGAEEFKGHVLHPFLQKLTIRILKTWIFGPHPLDILPDSQHWAKQQEYQLTLRIVIWKRCQKLHWLKGSTWRCYAYILKVSIFLFPGPCCPRSFSHNRLIWFLILFKFLFVSGLTDKMTKLHFFFFIFHFWLWLLGNSESKWVGQFF